MSALTTIIDRDASAVSHVGEQLQAQSEALRQRMAHVRHKLLVMSGKGGVGKSMSSVHIALGLARTGAAVGIVDADLNGPCIPSLLGIPERGSQLPLIGPLGIKVASLGGFVRRGMPIRWKGSAELSPIWLGMVEKNVLREFFADTEWGELDYLVVDLPPGAAADKPPVMVSLIPDLTGAIVVTTPSVVACEVVKKSIKYARGLGIPILGVIETMGGMHCPHCARRHPLFAGDTRALCRELGLERLGSVPFDPMLSASFDRGEPMLDVRGPAAEIYEEVVHEVMRRVDYARLVVQHL